MADRFQTLITRAKLANGKRDIPNAKKGEGSPAVAKPKSVMVNSAQASGNREAEHTIMPTIPKYIEDQPGDVTGKLIDTVREKPILLWAASALILGWLYIRNKAS